MGRTPLNLTDEQRRERKRERDAKSKAKRRAEKQAAGGKVKTTTRRILLKPAPAPPVETAAELKLKIADMVSKLDHKQSLVFRDRLLTACQYSMQNAAQIPDTITSKKAGVTITSGEYLSACNFIINEINNQ